MATQSDKQPVIESLGPDGEADWDAFVDTMPEATFFHRAGWKRVIEHAFGHRCHFLEARRGGVIQGILPLVHVKSRLFANALISTPFCIYGGPIAVSGAVRQALDDHACDLASRLGVDYLEMREPAARREDWPTKSLYYTFGKPLSETEADNLAAIPRKQRAVVRKSLQNDLGVEFDRDVDRLYALYALSLRNLGTPVFSKRYFKALLAVFGDRCEIMTVTHEKRAVASVFSFYDGATVMPYYAGAADSARDLKAHDFMYYALMCHGASRGASWFDFGRSKVETGAYQFKRHWGCEPRALAYQYYLVKARSIPDLSPANPRYERAIRVWQKLPLPVTRVAGPMLSRSLG